MIPAIVDRRGMMLMVLASSAMAVRADSLDIGSGLARFRQRRPFGAAVRAEHLFADESFRDAVRRECASITPELELKWDFVEPTRGNRHFYPADRLARFARTNGMTMHGHTLLWHKSIPGWAERSLRDDRDWSIVQAHFAAVIARYGATIRAWDVVNEPLDMGYRDDGLRPSPFLQAFGPDYIARALREARALAPDAKLLINEFGLTYDVPDERDRRYCFLKLIERLRAADVPLDCIGLQSHLELAKQPAFNAGTLAGFLAELAGMGLEIRVTELDVKEHAYTMTPASRDAVVADAVRRYLDVVAASPAVSAISCWGLSDRYSWLEVTREDLTRGSWSAGSGPGLNRGLPLDADFHPKPFYDVLKAALARPGG